MTRLALGGKVGKARGAVRVAVEARVDLARREERAAVPRPVAGRARRARRVRWGRGGWGGGMGVVVGWREGRRGWGGSFLGSGLFGDSVRTRWAGARAASTKVGSFRVVRAWRGVLVRVCLTVQTWRAPESKNSVGPTIRRQKV